MPNFVYTNNIPAAPHNPSVDQPDMQINTNSTDGILNVDHYSFNDNRGGYHKIIHQFPQTTDPTAIPNIGQLYTKTLNGQVTPFYESDTGVVYNVVNKSLSGLVTLAQGSPQILPGIIPDNCVGFLVVQNTIILGSPNSYFFSFSAYNGILDVQFSTSYLGLFTINAFPIPVVQPLVIAGGGGAPGSLQLVLTNIGVTLTNARWRYIYWPTL